MKKGIVVIRENEKTANKIAAKVMRVTFLVFTLIYVLNLVDIFIVDDVIMTIAYIGGSFLLLLPTLLTNILKVEHSVVKYINVICATIFVTLLSITLAFHVVVVYVYAIAIASLYFSKKLNILATIITVAGVSIGQILAFELHTLIDKNFTEFYSTIVFGVLPRALTLIAVAAIFTMLTSRTATLLSNLLGAEEQEKMLNSMREMKESATQTSETLFRMVTELSDISDTSLQTNQRIAEQTEKLLQGSIGNTKAVENADSKMQDINAQLVELSKMNHRTAALTEEIGENTRKNQQRMDDTTASMEQIHNSTNECKEIISNLGEESKEIIGIVQTITAISGKTNILALNASIEAARAGEHGKGFAVVASEIQKLAEQTKSAVEDIGRIVTQVVENTEDAVSAMEKSVQFTQSGLNNIQMANESTNMITTSNAELIEQIHAIDKAATIIQEKSSEIGLGMNKISNNTQKNSSAIEQVTAATQESTAGTENLTLLVVKVKELSEQLNKVVRES